MAYDVYIGDLDSPRFKWEGGDWDGNIPKRESPYFPPVQPNPFFTLIEKIKSAEFDGRQTDWAGWVAAVTKKQIQDFIQYLYANKYPDGGPLVAHLDERYEELCAFVTQLEDRKKYALVAAES